MIPSLRQSFNAGFTPEKFQELGRRMASNCGVEIPFRLCETPCFFRKSLLDELADAGRELILQLVNDPQYLASSNASIPGAFNVPNEPSHPMFIQVDFGLVKNAAGQLKPKLVELQAFPSLYGYQPVLAQAYIDTFELDAGLRYYLGGHDAASYRALLQRAVVGNHAPENVVLMEIHPEQQKTLPDFLATENLLGIKTVCITKIAKEGNRLFYERDGLRIPIERIYNRTIVDELERENVTLGFDFRDDLDVEWAGHPNWYFRISKFSIPYLKHESAPTTWFLDRMERVPDDLENYVLKPLYSFAGLGVKIGPSKQDIDAVPPDKRGDYILQERLHFAPVIETPFGPTKAELRMMYMWTEELQPVLTIVRMGRGLMMGVDHNKDMEWVGSSAALYV